MADLKLLVAALLALVPMVRAVTRVSYGGECNTTAKCDSRARLRCIEGQCGCLKLEEMIYDQEVEKCAVKAGERCKFLIGEAEGSTHLFDFLPCVNRSTCAGEGFCNCEPGFYDTAEGICVLAKQYNESCNS